LADAVRIVLHVEHQSWNGAFAAGGENGQLIMAADGVPHELAGRDLRESLDSRASDPVSMILNCCHDPCRHRVPCIRDRRPGLFLQGVVKGKFVTWKDYAIGYG
jgi:hypothetical protein